MTVQLPQSVVNYPLDAKAIAEAFGMTAEYIRRLARNDEIPFIQRGRKYYFNADEVDKALVERGETIKQQRKQRQQKTAKIESPVEQQTESEPISEDDIIFGI